MSSTAVNSDSPVDIEKAAGRFIHWRKSASDNFDGLQLDDDGNLIPQSGSVISNYTLFDKDDNEFEICELAEDYDLLLLLITRIL